MERIESNFLARRLFKVAGSLVFLPKENSIRINDSFSINLDDISTIRFRVFSVGSIAFLSTKSGRYTIATLNSSSVRRFQKNVGSFVSNKFNCEGKKFAEVLSSFLKNDGYLRESQWVTWQDLFGRTPKVPKSLAKGFEIEADVLRHEADLGISPDSIRSQIDRKNETFVEHELSRHKQFFDGLGLTVAQRTACVVHEDNNLIQAGAGTGKTKTIIGRVLYLIHKTQCRPEEIVILAYNKKAREEIENRLFENGVSGVNVSTFHAYGYDIVRRFVNDPVNLLPEAESGQIARLLERLIQKLIETDEDFRRNYLEFRLLHRYPYVPPHEFKTEHEFIQNQKTCNLTSLNGEILRSLQEVMVANFLAMNGIRYEYEPKYVPTNGSFLSRPYHPDFYLVDFNIYLEHFAINSEGKAPDFMGGDKYVQQMEWKRKLHLKEGTKLIESYSWQFYKQNGFAHLRRTLTEVGVKLTPVPTGEILSKVRQKEANDASELSKFFHQFISLFKNTGLTLEDIQKGAEHADQMPRSEQFLTLLTPIKEAYDSHCSDMMALDFDDMIAKASLAAKELGVGKDVKHVLVDEFQDSSLGRAGLLVSLREINPDISLFCVGDDWQSIYRFAGSDIRCITKYSDYFGFTRQVTLDQTFRYGRAITEASGEFVMRNEQQCKKMIQPAPNSEPCLPINIYYETEKVNPLHKALKEFAPALGDELSVLILTRYSFTLTDTQKAEVRREFSNKFAIQFSTVHSAKGLEADFVVICDVVENRNGFPSARADDPLIKLVMGEADKYPHAEERRLFYVAMTRAKRALAITTTSEGDEIAVSFQPLAVSC